jgi:hypothetical protein
LLGSLAADEQKNSYAKWFVLAIVVLLALLALQMVVAVRRDRRRAAERADELGTSEPEAGEADPVEGEPPRDYGVDALGDVDDLQVHDYAAPPAPEPDDTGEIEAVAEDYDYYEDDAAETETEPEPQPPPRKSLPRRKPQG